MQYTAPRSMTPDGPSEPFGQAGIFQYAGRLIAWLCLTVSLSALAMGHRSATYNDLVRWRGNNQVIDIVSGNGHLLFSSSLFQNRTFRNNTGWSYSGSYDRWWPRGQTEVARDWGAFGLEGGSTPQLRAADSGVWVRLSWPSLAALFMIQPVVWVSRRMVARYRRMRPAA